MGQHPESRPIIEHQFETLVAFMAPKAPPVRSIHEGFGRLWEQFDLLKQEVFHTLPSNSRVKNVLARIGAMAQHMAVSLDYTEPESFIYLVEDEINRARLKHPQGARSLHEGLAIIQEEFEEFKEEVFAQKPDRERAKAELVQIGAMAQRTSEDLQL